MLNTYMHSGVRKTSERSSYEDVVQCFRFRPTATQRATCCSCRHSPVRITKANRPSQSSLCTTYIGWIPDERDYSAIHLVKIASYLIHLFISPHVSNQN